MNAYGYFSEIEEENTPAISPAPVSKTALNTQLETIISTPAPAMVRNDMRRTHDRKMWASEVRKLLKSLNIKGVSVTAPNYSMAMSIEVSLPGHDWNEHGPVHEALEAEERAKGGPYMGMVQVCPFCKQSFDARNAIEKIILAAFPDLNNRSGNQPDDYHDYCLSINT